MSEEESHIPGSEPDLTSTLKPSLKIESESSIFDDYACDEPRPGPCAIIIFGATGDLTSRKLIPSLFRLLKKGYLSKDYFIIGVSRRKEEDDIFRESMRRALVESGDLKGEDDSRYWEDFSRRLSYYAIYFDDSEAYGALSDHIAEKEEAFKLSGNRIYYLATPPTVFENIVMNLGSSGLSHVPGSKVVIEKPFGRDLRSAKALDRLTLSSFDEGQVYRIDHYLGKETVQNIFMLRFANSIFEPLWDRRYIDHIQITAAETLGLEGRAGYYEESGVLRDMFQNHIIQILSIVAMEPPSLFETEAVRDERAKVLKALKPLNLERLKRNIVLGQYGEGIVEGSRIGAYRSEDGVGVESKTPTYAAMKIFIDNWRWNGVPFYIRSGKCLGSRSTEVAIQFKQVPHLVFGSHLSGSIGPNMLILKIQPNERLQLAFHIKSPGSRMCLKKVVMDLPYNEGYGGVSIDAYERVLVDCMLGDKMLFVRSDDVELSWSFLNPLLHLYDDGDKRAPDLTFYPAGSWGPVEGEILMEQDGRWWRNEG